MVRLAWLPLVFLLVGCNLDAPPPAVASETTTSGAETKTATDATKVEEPPGEPVGGTAAQGATVPKAGDDVAILETGDGRIVLKFFPDKAPNHVANFIDLAKEKFYDGTKFHRTIKGFMIQGGDPNTKTNNRATWGQGGPGKNIKAEFNDMEHKRGILSMARSGDPDSAGSQFFIMHGDNPSLDGQYTIFGQVIEGMDVVDKIAERPSDEANSGLAKEPVNLRTVRVVKWPVEIKR